MAKRGGQKIRAWVDPPPPSFGQCPKENVFFSIDVFPYQLYNVLRRKREKLLFVRLYGVMNKFPKKSERDDSVVGRSQAPEMGMILWTILNRQMTPKILQINNLFQNIFRFFQFWAQNVYEKK